MQATQYLGEIIKELHETVELIKDEEAEKLVNSILESNKIFVAGAGRSGFMAKSFAMRMMHMDLDSYVVGETVTPNLEKDDILVIASGSGETKSLVSMGQKAKHIGATLAIVTVSSGSTIGELADIVVQMPGSPKDKETSQYKTIQPMASLFEQTLLLLFDAMILRMMKKKELDSNTMFSKHANLE